MSKMSQAAAALDEEVGIADLQKAQASTKDAYEFLERLEAHTWCRKTQGEIQAYLRAVNYWPALNEDKTVKDAEL
jgi:hypothetical protein